MYIDMLVSFLDIETEIDIFCQLEGDFLLPHQEAANTMYFHLLLAGECSLQCNDGRTIFLTTGDFCLLPQGTAHIMCRETQQQGRYSKPSITAVQMLCGRFRTHHPASNMILKLFPDVLPIPLLDTESLQLLAKLIHIEALHNSTGSTAIIRHLCMVLLLFALRKLPDSSVTGAAPLFTDKRLVNAVTAILEKPAARLSVNDLATKAAMSRAAFARKFTAAAGMGVQQFARLLRLSLAAKALKQNASVSTAATAAGYASEAAFVQAFRSQFGQTPAAWRRQQNAAG